MTLTYNLSENDYLQYLLFSATKSERIKKERKQSLITVTFSLLVISLLFYITGNKILTYYFVAIAILCLVFYPLYLRSYYKNHYQKFLDEKSQNKLDEISTITLTENSIENFEKNCESKINLSELEEINETGQYFYLTMKMGGSLIIPKAKIED